MARGCVLEKHIRLGMACCQMGDQQTYMLQEHVCLGVQVDVWAVGVMLYQMLFGRRPFGEGCSQEEILRNEVMLKAHSVAFPAKPAISAECKDFITRCLPGPPTSCTSAGQMTGGAARRESLQDSNAPEAERCHKSDTAAAVILPRAHDVQLRQSIYGRYQQRLALGACDWRVQRACCMQVPGV